MSDISAILSLALEIDGDVPCSRTRYFLGDDEVEYRWKVFGGVGYVVSAQLSCRVLSFTPTLLLLVVDK